VPEVKEAETPSLSLRLRTVSPFKEAAILSLFCPAFIPVLLPFGLVFIHVLLSLVFCDVQYMAVDFLT
jgi:hypothetical protein